MKIGFGCTCAFLLGSMRFALVILMALSSCADARSCKKTIKKFKYKKILKACSDDKTQNVLGCFLERVESEGHPACQNCINEAIYREAYEPASCSDIWQEGWDRHNIRACTAALKSILWPCTNI